MRRIAIFRFGKLSLSSLFLSIKTKTNKSIILPVDLYGCETWFYSRVITTQTEDVRQQGTEGYVLHQE